MSFSLRYIETELLKLHPEYSRTGLYKHAVKSIGSTQVVDKRKSDKGNAKNVSIKEERIILREIRKLRKEFGSFAIKSQRLVSELGNKVCDESVRNLLKKKGYIFLHSRNKGLLKPKDLKESLKFSRKIKGTF